ncbi:VCBS repeat-containing protein [Verrucomicrobiales bacterium]|nr:VCBS repeat-containing protein [Verrucomicrobiales bacterium]
MKQPCIGNKEQLHFQAISIAVACIIFSGCSKNPSLKFLDDEISQIPLNKISTEPSEKLFIKVEPEHSGINFQIELGDFFSRTKEYMFATPMGGVATGDYDGDSLPDIYLTSPDKGNRLYKNKGNFKFEDVTEKAGLYDPEFWGTGAGFVDIDGDKDLDLYACGYLSPNRLYINDGKGTFTNKATSLGLDFNGASMNLNFADIDGDQDLDAYLATTMRTPPQGTKFGVRYVQQPDGSEKPVIPQEISEYWQFLYLPNKKIHRTESGQADVLYKNDNGKFVNYTKQSGIKGNYFSLCATWWDYDSDNAPDIYVSNDYLGPDILYKNNGNGTFTDTIRSVVPHTPWFSMGSDTGDINNDGLIDFFATDMAATSHYREKVMMGNMDNMGWFLEFAQPRQYMRNSMYLNTGTNKMLEAANLLGIASSDWSWSPRLEDFDGDGLLDLFVTNGVLRDSMNSDISSMAEKKFKGGSNEWRDFWASQPMRKETNLAFKNLGDLKFIPTAKEWGLDHNGVSFGAATADFDGDGDPDLIINNADGPATIYRNNSNNNRVSISLNGNGKNSHGIGCKVKVITGKLTQIKEMNPVRGWLSSNEPMLYFGLGEHDAIDLLVVEWRNGTSQTFNNIKANQLIVIKQTSATQPKNTITKTKEPSIYAKSKQINSIIHSESSFDDFKIQPLLPNKQSTRGPTINWADFDGDNDSDLFIGGSAKNPGRLFRNDNGKLNEIISKSLNASKGSEDVNSLWFDADSDNDLDLVVISGSNEFPTNDKRYNDRLYLNDGTGTLSISTSFPTPPISSNAVCTIDINKDSHPDLIIAGAAKVGQYPEAYTSYSMINSGTGKFTLEPLTAMADAGLINDLITADIDNDGSVEIIAACEWGPVRIYRNNNGTIEEQTSEWGLSHHTGWWNSLSAADLDNDGDIDLVATNYGLNTKYKANKTKPELLYYSDFDQSGENNIVEAKYEGDAIVPRRGFSCSQLAMPFLKDKLKTFHNFASSNLETIYSPSKLAKSKKYEVNTLEHTVLMNEENRFKVINLPRESQIAPSFGTELVDINDDGILDIIMAHNFFSPQRETGRMDGGLSLVLKGNGDGTFTPLPHYVSGISISGDTRKVSAIDLDGNGIKEIAFAQNDGPMIIYSKNAK